MDPFRPFHSQSERERPCKAVLTFESVDEIMCSDHSNETFSAVLSRGTIYLVCCSNFWVYGSNPMVLPFKWKLYSSTFTWYYSVADPDLHIGGGGWSSRPWDGGGGASKNFFFGPWGLIWGGPGPLAWICHCYWLFRSCFYKKIHGNYVDFYFSHFWEWKVKAPYSETLNAGMTREHQSMFSTHSAISH